MCIQGMRQVRRGTRGSFGGKIDCPEMRYFERENVFLSGEAASIAWIWVCVCLLNWLSLSCTGLKYFAAWHGIVCDFLGINSVFLNDEIERSICAPGQTPSFLSIPSKSRKLTSKVLRYHVFSNSILR